MGPVVQLILFFFSLLLSSFWTKLWSQVSSPSPPPVRAFIYIFAHRVQHSHRSSIFYRMVANSRSRAFREFICAHKKNSLRIHTSMHSGGLEVTQLTNSRHEDNLFHHRGDRLVLVESSHVCVSRICGVYSVPVQQQPRVLSVFTHPHVEPSRGRVALRLRGDNSAVWTIIDDDARQLCLFLSVTGAVELQPGDRRQTIYIYVYSTGDVLRIWG